MRPPESGATAPPPSASALRPDPVEEAAFTRPALPRGVVRRPRLEQRLDVGLRGPLTLVTAPAGTGKTVLVSSWVSRLRAAGTVVWLSLDDDAAEPATFWRLVVTGLARGGLDIGPTGPAGRGAGNPASISLIADRVLAHHDPVVLVLDCDCTLSAQVTAALDRLIHLCAARLHTVLLSREDPLLPLHRYRLTDSLVEVRMADLACTPAEARAMLAGMAVHLSPEAMEATIARTQGWAAGLRMAAMYLAHRQDRDEAARQLAGDTGTVAEYLLAEVLNAQPQGLRRLLLDTSIADVLRPGLASALAGPHADRALSFLVHGNAFLEELLDSPSCYRYHHLFRELLRAQLAYESPERVVELHRVAASWSAEHALVEDAVRHATTIGDWESAARYAVDGLSVVALLADQPTDPLLDDLAKIPNGAGGAAVSVVAAARAVALGDGKRADLELQRAHDQLKVEPSQSWPAGELAMALLELVRARGAGDAAAALDAATRAQELLPAQEQGRLAAHPEINTVIQSNLGAALVLAGRPDEAAEAFRTAAPDGAAGSSELPVVDALGQGALLAALRGDLQRSADLASQAIDLQSTTGLSRDDTQGAADAALAYVHTERYELSAGRHHAARAGGRDPSHADPLPATVLALAQARISRAAGDLETALTVLESAESSTGLPVWLDDLVALEKVAVLVAQGASARAIEVAQRLKEPGALQRGLLLARGAPDSDDVIDLDSLAHRGPPSPLPARVDLLVQSATRHVRDGQESRAVRDLDRALGLAAPQLARRAFREAPPELWQLLRKHSELLVRHGWLTDRHATGPGGAGIPQQRAPLRDVPAPQEPVVYEALTLKEEEVLGHLSELLTTEEIAAVMFISVNTVRTHVRNILRKLSASRRNEAVRRARDLGLLPT